MCALNEVKGMSLFMNMDFSEVGIVVYRGLISLVALFFSDKNAW